MVNIQLENVGKRFLHKWIFKEINEELNSNNSYHITGHNGSGKSTLLKIISGYVSPSEGKVELNIDGRGIGMDDWAKNTAICAPYLELIEEFRLDELLAFHQKMKPLENEFSTSEFADLIELNYEKDKAIRFFSSGMKQRVKLGLALFSSCPVVLLDEPTSNLDEHGISWYKRTVEQKNNQSKLIIVCSNNVSDETFFCNKKINIEDFIPKKRKR